MNVSSNRTTGLYIGTGLTLTCSVMLRPIVNNKEYVTISWSGVQLSESQNIVTPATGSGQTFMSNLIISPLSQQNDGAYDIICTATIRGGSNSRTATSNSHTIDVLCKYYCWWDGLLLLRYLHSSS